MKPILHSEDDPTSRAIRQLASTFGRRLDNEAVAVWARALRPHDMLVMMRIFRYASEWPKMPTLGELLNAVRAQEKADLGAKKIPELSQSERDKSDRSAVKAMLWLHYEKRWGFSDFAGNVFERNFGKDPQESLRVAAQFLSKSDIAEWMKAQDKPC